MFNIFGNLFRGIINFITGLFGSKKSKKGKYYLELEEDSNTTTQPATTIQPKPEPAKAKPEAVKVKTPSQPQPTTTPAKPESNKNSKVLPEKTTTFATDYLMPTPSQSRRRPGPSMGMFRDMARKVQNSND